MSFIVYDLVLLALFLLFVTLFIYRGKKNVKKEGLLILYKTKWGIKLIEHVGKKYKKTLKVLSYVSVTTGYILMGVMVYLFGKIVWIYAFSQDLVRAVKVPPIMPLFPYLPQAFNLDFLPPFYFTYWIVIIAIIAITHELAHGFFAAYDKVKIKQTGFGFFPFFLPIFIAAFVEPDEKQMQKKSIFSQLSVLSAGTFANILTALLFIIILFGFFSLAFAPAGVSFDTYATGALNVTSIYSIGNMSLNGTTYQNILNSVNENGLTKINSSEGEFVVNKYMIEEAKDLIDDDSKMIAYIDSPAIRVNLESIILAIEGVPIKSVEDLQFELGKYRPGETITLNVLGEDNEGYNVDVVLDENPEDKSKGWLGVGFIEQDSTGLMNKLVNFFTSFKKPHIYYSPQWGEFSVFLYHLIWWTILISISVALVNMLPVGIFDGGRFFYLTILAITKKKKIAEKAFGFVTYLFLLLVVILMVLWAVGIF